MKIISRLEIANELQACEKRKEQFQKQLKAIESHYFKSGDIFFQIETDDYEHKGIEEFIEFVPELMIEYIRKEIEKLQVKSNKLIEKLSLIQD